MTRTSVYALAMLLAFSANCQTAEPYAWDADTFPPQTAMLQIWRGDTVPLAPRWGSSDTNGWTFTCYWSTNSVEWWSKSLSTNAAPSVVGDPFVWSPAMDCGARRYRLFILASNAGGGSYRANASITMLDSPGTNPAILPAPNAYPALASELLGLMIPYLPTYDAWSAEQSLRAAGDASGSNYVDAVAYVLRTQMVAIANSSGGTGSVGRATASDSALKLVSADSNWWVTVDSGTATLWRVTAEHFAGALYYGHYDLLLSTNFQTSTGIKPATNYWHDITTGTITSGLWRIYIYQNWSYKFGIQYNGAGGPIWANGTQVTLPTNSITFSPYFGSPSPQGSAVLSPLYYPGAYTNAVGTYLTAEALASALASYGYASSISNAMALASNAWLAASSVPSQIAAATNALVQTYLVSSNAWITADFSNRTVSVSLVSTNSVTNTVVVGGSTIDPQATNLLWIALQQSNAAIAAKADKAWGSYTPDGAANPDPAYMTFLNAPATLFASGCSWSAYGTYAVLTTPGTVAYSSGTNGTLRIGPDSTNYFGYAVGGSVTVGAVPNSIRVYNGGATNGYAEISYAYSGGDYPTLWFTPSLAVDFTLIASVAWVDNLDGTATVTAPAQSAAGFYKATTTATFSNYFLSTMPALFSGGVVAGTNDLPVVYNSVLTITNNGHTYRVAAQRVQ